jgi:hypothetical protein
MSSLLGYSLITLVAGMCCAVCFTVTSGLTTIDAVVVRHILIIGATLATLAGSVADSRGIHTHTLNGVTGIYCHSSNVLSVGTNLNAYATEVTLYLVDGGHRCHFLSLSGTTLAQGYVKVKS